ncbi:MAG: T9SS type A sorting domain-containing protein [Candidatus Edwardsbacteria bacterium]|nr:T9SS type A sorting domain-containing protein [Candidatus Edwardsbacteria bacterium]
MKRAFLFATILALAATAWALQPVVSTGIQPVRHEAAAQPPATAAAPKAITWTTLDSIDPAASRLAAAAVDGKIYRVGGNVQATTYSGAVEEFDPATGQWTGKAPLPVPCSNLSAAVWRDRIYVVGGSSASGYVGNLQIYYPDGDSAAQGPALPATAYGVAVAVVADTLYMIGGNNGATINTVFACDLIGGTWTAKTPMPTARYFAGAATINGKVYVVGGYNGSDLAVCERYDPAADTAGGTPWTAMTPMGTARGGLGVAAIGGRVYAFGGGYSSYLNTVERYDPAADTSGGAPWTADGGFVTGRRTIGAASLGNDAYVIGGWNGNFRNNVERGTTDAPVVEDIFVQGLRVTPYVGNYGAVVHPAVALYNQTPFIQYNVPLTLRIDSAGVPVYEHKVFCAMYGPAGYDIPMPDWRPCTTPGIVYDVTAYSALTTDQNNANDTVRTTVEVKDAVWYQYDPAGATSIVSQNCEPANDAFDCWIADDFTVEGVDTVRIDSVAVRGFFMNGAPVPDSLSIIITADSSWYPAFSQTVASAMVPPAGFSVADGDFIARLTTPILLPAAERYWLSCQLHMNYATYGFWYWTSVDGSLNYATQSAYLVNPGDGFGMGWTSWVPIGTVSSGVTDLCFALYGGEHATGVAGNPVAAQPRPDFILAQVSPNPVRGGARFSFSLAKPGDARLDVYSLLGQKVASVAEGHRDAGRHSVSWNGRDPAGRPVAAGLYFYRLTADGRSLTRKFVVVR